MKKRLRRKKATNIPDVEIDNINLKRHQKRMNAFKKRRKINKTRITMIRMRSSGRFLSILLLMWLIFKVATLPGWFFDKDLFKKNSAENLAIVGNQIVSQQQVTQALKNVKVNKKPVYLFNTGLIEKKLIALPPVKKVYIRRFWFPARMTIALEEKKPALAISPSTKVDAVAVFTDDGTIIGKEFFPIPNVKGLYKILTYDNYKNWTKIHVHYFIYLSKLLEQASNDKMVYIDMRNPDDVYIQLKTYRLRVGELNATVFKRTSRITSVIPKLNALKGKMPSIEYIDLRWEKTIPLKLKNSKPTGTDKQKTASKPKTKPD